LDRVVATIVALVGAGFLKNFKDVSSSKLHERLDPDAGTFVTETLNSSQVME
jgi:hypothetical protein